MSEHNKQKRLSSNEKQNLEEENKQIKERFDALMDVHSETKNKVLKLEAQLKSYTMQSSTFTDNTVRLRQLELEKLQLSQKASVYEEQARNFESENQKLALQLKNIHKNYEEINLLYVNLLQGEN